MVIIREIAKLVGYGTKSIKAYRDLKTEKITRPIEVRLILQNEEDVKRFIKFFDEEENKNDNA
jgi:hypothetical protein